MPTSPSTLHRDSLPSAVRILTRGDLRLARLVARHGVPPLWARRPGFASLLSIILEQQVSLASAQAIYHRLATAVEQVRPESILALGTVGLQGLGLTRQKASYACGLALQVLEGQLALDRLGLADGLGEGPTRRLKARRHLVNAGYVIQYERGGVVKLVGRATLTA